MVVGAAEASALEGGGERRQLWRTKRSLQTGGSLLRFRIELDMTYLVNTTYYLLLTTHYYSLLTQDRARHGLPS